MLYLIVPDMHGVVQICMISDFMSFIPLEAC